MISHENTLDLCRTRILSVQSISKVTLVVGQQQARHLLLAKLSFHLVFMLLAGSNMEFVEQPTPLTHITTPRIWPEVALPDTVRHFARSETKRNVKTFSST